MRLEEAMEKLVVSGGGSARKAVRLIVVGILAGWIGFTASAQESDGEVARGVVVEEVGKGSALEKAGIEPGDVLLSWRRLASPSANPEEARGEFGSVFDWMWVVVEQAPRGTVEISGLRNRGERRFKVTPGLWEAEVRPWMSDELLVGYRQILRHSKMNQTTKSLDGLDELIPDKEESWQIRCWIALQLGRGLSERTQSSGGEAEFRLALEEAREPYAQSVIWHALGEIHMNKSTLKMAQDAYSSARAVQEKAWAADTLALAESLSRLGEVLMNRASLGEASELFQRALKIRERLAPKSLLVAESLNMLGAMAWYRRDLESASKNFQSALTIQEDLAPESLAAAQSLNDLGTVAWSRGDLPHAERLHQRALSIRRELAPGSLMIAESLNNLGENAKYRGDLDLARDYHQRAFRIFSQLMPGSASVAISLNNLGTVAWLSDDLGRAVDHYQSSLETWRELGANGIEMAHTFNNLGAVAFKRADYSSAEGFFRQAFEIWQQLAPGSLEIAFSMHNLGSVAYRRGDQALAEDWHRKALDIKRQWAPGSVDEAFSLHELALVALERKDFEAARLLELRALEILETLAPFSIQLAQTFNSLGRMHLRADPPQLKIASKYFGNSIDALENQLARFGGAHALRSGFRARYYDFYREAIEVQLERRNVSGAFHTLERSRARGFLEQITERDLVFGADIPAELDQERRILASRVDVVQQELGRLNRWDDADKIDELLRRLGELRAESLDIEEKIRRVSPKLAALRYPVPLNVDSARSILDPGTLLLSYSVGEEDTILFTLGWASGLQVKTISIGEAELRDKVRGLLRQTRNARTQGSQRMQRLAEISRDLFERLITPVEALIEESDRVVLVGDGALHYIPWGILIRKRGDKSDYLMEWKPIHIVLSATVYSEIIKARDGSGGSRVKVRVAAFGDPQYPSDGIDSLRGSDPVVRRAGESGFLNGLDPLPHSRREVEGVVALFPSDDVSVYLGNDATETQVKRLGRDLDIVHLAAHGRINRRFPMNSFLVFSVPDEFHEGVDNGLLQVWEIYESVRLQADLVVLSACETALGEEQRGEGLISLARAFQYAGARSVVASLWSVADQTTAELMIRFYRHLRSGLPKDEALRAAQLEFIRGPIEMEDADGNNVLKDAAAPYYWAGFQVFGDWQ